MQLVDNKRIAKNTLMLYVRMIFLMLITLYTSRVILNQLGVDDYGVYNVVGGVVAMLSFFNNSMSTATQRYLAYAIGRGDKELENKTFKTALILHVMIAGVMLLLAETLGIYFVKRYIVVPQGQMAAAIWVYHFSVLTAIINILSVPFISMLIAHEQMSVYAYISIMEGLLKLGVAFMLILISYQKLRLYAVLVFGSTVVVAITWAIICQTKYSFKRERFQWETSLFRQMSGFVGWQTIASICLLLRTQGVNILLNMFFGPALNAARAIAVQVSGAVSGFSLNFQTASLPQVNKLFAAERIDEMKNLVFRTSKVVFILLFLLSLPVLLISEPLLNLWLVKVPPCGTLFVRLAIVGCLVDSFSGIIGYAALSTGKVKRYQLTMSSLFIFNIILVFVAYKMGLSATSMYYIEIIFYILALFFRLYLVNQMLGFPIYAYLREIVCREIMMIIVCCLLCVPLLRLLPHNWCSYVFVAIFSMIAVAITSLYIVLNEFERKWIFEKILNKLRK